MVGKSLKGAAAGGGKAMLGKAKQHFFRDLDLTDVIHPSEDEVGTFTGGPGPVTSKPNGNLFRQPARLACTKGTVRHTCQLCSRNVHDFKHALLH